MALLRSDEPFLHLRKDHLPVVVWFDENTGGGFDRRELAAVTPLDPVSHDDIHTVVRVLLHAEERVAPPREARQSSSTGAGQCSISPPGNGTSVRGCPHSHPRLTTGSSR